MSPQAFQTMDRRQAVMLFMAMLGLLALPEGEAEAAEPTNDWEDEFGPSDCRNVTTFPNCPDRPYRYSGAFVARDGSRAANADLTIEEGRVIISGMFSEPVVIPAGCNGAIDFVDQMAKALDDVAADRGKSEAAQEKWFASVIDEHKVQAAEDRALPPDVTPAFTGNFFAFSESRQTHGKLSIVHEREGVRLRFGEFDESNDFELVSETVIPHPEGRDFMVKLSRYSDAQFEQYIEGFLSKPWMITCPDCKGDLSKTRACQTCHGEYGGIVPKKKAEEEVKRWRTERRARIAAITA